MSAFEYLSTFMAIILGLAVVHLLGGVSLILDRRVLDAPDTLERTIMLAMLSVLFAVAARTPSRRFHAPWQ